MGGECLIFDLSGPGVNVLTPLRLQLHGMAEQDGTVVGHGSIILWGEGRVPTVIVAAGTGAAATCADTDDDGRVGVVELTVPFREARTGEIVTVRIMASGEQDLDAAGRYPVTIAIDNQVVEAEVRFTSRWVDIAPGPR